MFKLVSRTGLIRGFDKFQSISHIRNILRRISDRRQQKQKHLKRTVNGRTEVDRSHSASDARCISCLAVCDACPWHKIVTQIDLVFNLRTSFNNAFDAIVWCLVCYSPLAHSVAIYIEMCFSLAFDRWQQPNLHVHSDRHSLSLALAGAARKMQKHVDCVRHTRLNNMM